MKRRKIEKMKTIQQKNEKFNKKRNFENEKKYKTGVNPFKSKHLIKILISKKNNYFHIF